MVFVNLPSVIFVAIALIGQTAAVPNNGGKPGAVATTTSSSQSATTPGAASTTTALATMPPVPAPTCYVLVTRPAITVTSSTTPVKQSQNPEKRENWGKGGTTVTASTITTRSQAPTTLSSVYLGAPTHVVVTVTAAPTGTSVLWCNSTSPGATSTTSSQDPASTAKDNSTENKALGVQDGTNNTDKSGAGKVTAGIILASAMSLFGGLFCLI